MKRIVLALAAVLACTALVATDADAKRLGGARSFGAQRSVTPAPSAVPARPAQPQAAPAAQPGAQPQPAAPQPASGFARWAPMLGGLALGGALGWLMGANGMGGLLVGVMLAALLAFVAVALVRMLAQRRSGPQPAYAGAQPGAYSAMGSETVAAPPPSQSAGFERPAPPAATGARVPEGFDVGGFLRGAKLNYMRLQLANDQGNLDELREFTTDEVFEELKRDVLARGGAKQQTDVMALNADLLEVVTEGDRHWASIRFSGTVRESPGVAPQGFEEVWNLAKPVHGAGGWQLAGIQQMH